MVHTRLGHCIGDGSHTSRLGDSVLSRILGHLALFTALMAAPAMAVAVEPLTPEEDFDPNSVSEADAIDCRLDVPTYNGFAFALGDKDGVAARRGWKKIESGNIFMNEYELPAPIIVAERYSTRRIGVTSNAMVAILDLADPSVIAKQEGVENALDAEDLIEAAAEHGISREQVERELPFRKFMGERVLVDETEAPGTDGAFGSHVTIARSISNVTTHPGKTLYGCSYRMELLGRDGKPL
ncbi:MAG: hypothetical protein QM605_06990 [Sphingobium sp.]